MASFELETDRVRVAWHGDPAPPDAAQPGEVLRAKALRGGAVRVRGSGAALAEHSTHRVLVRSVEGHAVALHHADPVLVRRVVRDGADGSVLAAVVDFRGTVGEARFVVEAGGRPELAFTVTVAPTRVSAAEAEAMRAEVDAVLAGLALDYLRGAHRRATPVEVPSVRASWLTLVRHALPRLERALEGIARGARWDVRRGAVPLRAERVRRPDALVRRALARAEAECRPVLPTRHALPTLDTPEHRWLRARVERAWREAVALLRAERALPPTPRRRRTCAHLDDVAARLERLRRTEPLASATPGPPPAPTPRLLRAAGYAEAYAAARRLALGLALGAGPLRQATRDLPALYETWVFLTVARTLAELLGTSLPPQGFFRADMRGIRLRLRRGRRHAVRLEGRGVRVELVYEPRLDASGGLLVQRPDLLLTVEREHEPPRWFVLDAKYRRVDDATYVRRFGAPGPPEDALGDLHRYRDAILTGTNAPQRIVEAAVAIYPWRADPAFGASQLWRALETVGVGAIPLLPGQALWLRRWLAQILEPSG